MIIKPISISGNDYFELIKIDESESKYNEDWLQEVIHKILKHIQLRIL